MIKTLPDGRKTFSVKLPLEVLHRAFALDNSSRAPGSVAEFVCMLEDDVRKNVDLDGRSMSFDGKNITYTWCNEHSSWDIRTGVFTRLGYFTYGCLSHLQDLKTL